MSDKNQSDETRRTFMKGAAATGVAATGLTALSGGAAAQDSIRPLNVRDVNLDLQEGVVNVNISNVNILRDFDDIVVTVIGGDVVGGDLNVNILRFEDEVNINVIRDSLNDLDLDVDVEDNVVQVAVLALSNGLVAAQGSGATN